ncbi:Crp/Fnr family transcriptional regulator [Methylophaga sp. OBS3]|uniref:Crp/Fnr family transcriptional regulator n=1 Tax=Methylophaga sp. OBS3 TaxID=2991934 RepID=UPI0022575940|nr:Crp/Fnr family transcriptional regulator [Methylophaga sp. OBS3]MCX4189689.1 Crp/Fnr family transcriptional regulator [Methylophaga sp. OBS3]
MNSLEPSCIVHQFERFAELTPTEQQLLHRLEDDPRNYDADQEMAAIGSTADKFFTLQSGWAFAVRTLADGQRQILDIFLPGQIIGLRDVSVSHNLSEIRTLTDVVACPFPRQRLTDIFDQAPRLTDLFFLIMAREQSMLMERVINIGRRNAAERLAHFLVEIQTRLAIRSLAFTLPMNQTLIADTLSLSSVHVSRTFKQLREMGFVENQNGEIEIIDLEGLIDFSGFDRSYLEFNSEWARPS